jgi:hypothetical protein
MYLAAFLKQLRANRWAKGVAPWRNLTLPPQRGVIVAASLLAGFPCRTVAI